MGEQLRIGIDYAINELLKEENSVTYYYLCDYTKAKNNNIDLNVEYKRLMLFEIFERTYYNFFDDAKCDLIYPNNNSIKNIQKYLGDIKYSCSKSIFVNIDYLYVYLEKFFGLLLYAENKKNMDSIYKMNMKIYEIYKQYFFEKFFIYNEANLIIDESLRDINSFIKYKEHFVINMINGMIPFESYYGCVQNNMYYDKENISRYLYRKKAAELIKTDKDFKKTQITRNIVKIHNLSNMHISNEEVNSIFNEIMKLSRLDLDNNKEEVKNSLLQKCLTL